MPDNSSFHRTNRRKYLTTVGAVISGGLAGCMGGGENGSGDNGGDESYSIGFSIKNMNNPWLEVFSKTGEIYAEAKGHEIQTTHAGGNAGTQIQNVNSMIQRGIDALLISPYSSNAAIQAVEDATDADIPVYTANSTAPTEAVNLFTGFGAYQAGQRAAETMLEAVKERGGSRVLNLVGDQADQSAVRRSQGFLDTVEADGEVEVAQTIYNEEWSQDRATTNMNAFMEAGGDIDGVYSVWGGGALAAVQVLESHGMLSTVGEDDYIPIINIDGFPGVLNQIRNGYIMSTLQQPMPFYFPISFEYMLRHLESGEADVPEAGSELTADDIEIEDVEYEGVRPFSEPYWEPAQVTDWEADETVYHPWLQPRTVEITEENVDAEYLWGNYASEIL